MALFNDEQSDGLISIPLIRLFLLLVNDKLSSVNRPLTFLPVKIVNFSKLAKFFLLKIQIVNLKVVNYVAVKQLHQECKQQKHQRRRISKNLQKPE